MLSHFLHYVKIVYLAQGLGYNTPMRVLDSMTGKKIPLTKNRTVRMFVCGPTVYDRPHIGNARPFLVYDAFARYLHKRNYKIFYLQNITDIDDKIIDRAQKEKTTWSSVARQFEKIYRDNEAALGIASVTKHARATDFIPQIVKQVQVLVDKKYAYRIDGEGYYFDISRFKEYGKLSKRTVQQAEDAVSRIDEGTKKRNKGDFALWKFSKPQEPSWDTALGEGRPGWHIEDTAITHHHFGPQYDIHGGAVELKFPHHEAEIAQQEAASGKKPMVKIWMHTGILLVGGRKMAKSAGNFISISDFLKEHGAAVLRYIVLSHHYRSPIDYSPALVTQARQSLLSLQHFIWKLDLVRKEGKKTGHVRKVTSATAKARREWNRALEDDFNTPAALAALFALVGIFEQSIWSISRRDAETLHHALMVLLETIGLSIEKKPRVSVPARLLMQMREILRRRQQFIQADNLRAKTEALGYSVDDTPCGPFLYPTVPPIIKPK
jgi:cysteinyl-tRNA synthetase